MEYAKNERGSALVSVMYLVLLVSMITVPLLLLVNQGTVNATRTAEAERAYYAAQSGSTILRRALSEAINSSQIRMNEPTINTLVALINAKQLKVNNTTIALNNLQNTKIVVSGQPVFTSEQTSTANYAVKNKTRSQSSTLKFKVDPGNANTNPYAYNNNSIFGLNAVVPNSSMVTNHLQDGTSATVKPAPQQAITGTNYMTQFDTYYNAQVAAKPGPLAPDELTAVPDAPTGYSYTNGSLTINGNRGSGAYYTGNISVKKSGGGGSSSIVINGDLVAQGNIDFQDFSDITVNGSIIAGGDINFNNTFLSSLKVTGSIMSGNTAAGATGITFDQGASVIDIGGSLTSKTNIKVHSFTTSMTVAGSILAGNQYTMGQGGNLTVTTGEISAKTLSSSSSLGNISVKKGVKTESAMSFASVGSISVGSNFSSKGSITFTNNVSTFKIWPSGSLISGGTIKTASMDTLTIESGSISAAQDINFTSNITNATIKGSGNLVAGGNITVGSLTNWYLTGSISSGTVAANGTVTSGGNVTFTNGGMPQFEMGGSIYAPGQLSYSYISNFTTHGSIYAGTTSTPQSIGTLQVDGAFMSKGPLSFQSIDNFNVGGFLASEGAITFNSNIDTNPKPTLGGISTPVGVTMPGYLTYPIIVNYNPPGGTSGSAATNPVITFDNWGS